MIASWLIARRREASGQTRSVGAALWPFVLDLVALAAFAYLIMVVVVWSAYAEPSPPEWISSVAFLGGIVVFAACLANALVTTWRAMRAR